MFRYLLYQIEYYRWFFVAIAAAFLVHLLPHPASLPAAGQSVLAIVFMTVLLVIFEPVPLPVVSLLIVVLEVIFELGSPRQVAQSFMSDSVVFIAGALMLAVAIVKQQLDKRVLFFILRLTGDSIVLTILVLVGLTALLTSVMGETAVASIMLPVSLVLVRMSQQVPPEGNPAMHKIFPMAVAYGAAVASLGTPSGGARNAIMIGYLERLANLRVGYLEWTILMYPLIMLEVPAVFLLLRRLYGTGTGGGLSQALGLLRQEAGQQRKLRSEDWITIINLLITVALWMSFSKQLGLGPIALIGVLLCVVTGVLTWEDINRDVNWGVAILYAAVISIGLWMDSTGAADWIAIHLQDLLRFMGVTQGFWLILALTLVSMVVGAILSSGPAIALMGPVILREADLTGSNPLVLGMVLVASASYANFSPVSSPACTIVYGSGMVARQDYFRTGFWVVLASFPIILFFAEFYWPLIASFY